MQFAIFSLIPYLARDRGTHDSVRSFHLVRYRFTNVMEQTTDAGRLHIPVQFLGDHGCEMRGFHGVVELVLPVAGTELQPAQQLLQFAVQARNSRFY